MTLALLVGGLIPGGPSIPAAADSGDGLEQLGVLPVPKGWDSVNPVLTDPVNRRLYARVDRSGSAEIRLYEYDLTTKIPSIRRFAQMAPFGGNWNGLSGNTVALDAEGRRMFVLEQPQSGTCPACTIVRVWDLSRLRMLPETWNLTLLVPNFAALGITFSPEDGRLYAVGTLIGPASVTFGSNVLPMVPTAVVAIDAIDGTLAWVRPLPECQYPGFVAPGQGAGLFRSKRLSALYIPCIRPEPTFIPGTFPGQSGLIRLWITAQAGSPEAVTFRREVFPISGVYANGGGLAGMSVFDEAADRVYILNQSKGTSGVWVFDGLLSAWVGFVPAGDETNNQLGLDQSTGHMYMRYSRGSGGDVGERDAPLLVSDGRATPVPQGEVYPLGPTSTNAWILTDPVTHRVFVRGTKSSPTAPERVLVLIDRTPSAEPVTATDYDGLTTDVAEGPGTLAIFQGSVKGFGARVSLVGGYGGALSPVNKAASDVGQPQTIPGVKPAPRSVILGRAASLELSSVSAGASAQAVAPDSVTADEYESYRKDVGTRAGEASSGLAEQLYWPWPAAVCIDAEEKAAGDKEDAAVGRSSVNCDLKAARASSSTSSGRLLLEGVSLDGGSFVANVSRDANDGTVTEATAVSRGLEVTLPGVGTLSIGRVTATVQTVAHGRPGTASVRWVREIDGVLLKDADGQVLFRCPDACSPQAVADAVNENIGQRVRVVIPEAERLATARGAFAGIKETRTAYLDGLIVNDDDSRAVPALEIQINNDTAEKSRLIVQLAAIEASSIYAISLVPQEGALSPPLLGDVPSLPPPPVIGDLPGLDVAPPAASGNGSTLLQARSSFLAVRSAADALFVALICLFLIATVVGAIRRHRYVSILNGGTRT